jgi:hypothetical protein
MAEVRPTDSARGQRAKRRRAQRAAALRGMLQPGEVPVVTTDHVLLTARRVIFAESADMNGGVRQETPDALAFDEIEGWARGERHDQRPLVRLDHVPHERVERVFAHRFLWFRWGNAWAPVTRRTTVLRFNSIRDTALAALTQRLRADGVPQGTSFVILPYGWGKDRVREVEYLSVDERPA